MIDKAWLSQVQNTVHGDHTTGTEANSHRCEELKCLALVYHGGLQKMKTKYTDKISVKNDTKMHILHTSYVR